MGAGGVEVELTGRQIPYDNLLLKKFKAQLQR